MSVELPADVLKTPLRAVRLDLRCAVCVEGFLHVDVLAPRRLYPPEYLHRCSKCSRESFLDSTWPQIVYEDLPADVGVESSLEERLQKLSEQWEPPTARKVLDLLLEVYQELRR